MPLVDDVADAESSNNVVVSCFYSNEFIFVIFFSRELDSTSGYKVYTTSGLV